MDQENFRDILGELNPKFSLLKPLAGSLRQILFLLSKGWGNLDRDRRFT